MNLDILANGAPPPWRRKNDGKDSERIPGHLGKDSVAYGNLRYYRRKAGGPARLRSASVVQRCFTLKEFSIRFPILIRVQASPEKQNTSELQKGSRDYVGAVVEQLLWF